MRVTVVALLGVLLAAAAPAARSGVEPTTRKVYVTVSDGKGNAIPDLTAADFVVKEGGKEREIVKAERATARIRLAVFVEERMIGDTRIRMGVFEFLKRLQPYAEMAIITVGLRNTTVVNYTNDLNQHVDALNKMTLNPPPQSNLTEGMLDLGKSLEKDGAERSVIVAIAFSGGQAGGASSNEVLNQLRQSGATMYSVTLAAGSATSDKVGTLGDDSNREQVLGDGAKQSGGRRIESVAPAAIQGALMQVADDIGCQYLVQYALPEGVKADKRFNVNVKRKGVSLRAPSLIPDR